MAHGKLREFFLLFCGHPEKLVNNYVLDVGKTYNLIEKTLNKSA